MFDAVGIEVAHADHLVRLVDQPDRGRAHAQCEGRFLGRGAGEQVEEVPLRHHGDVSVPAGNPGEIGGDHHAVTRVHAHASQRGVRQLGELGAEP